MLLNCPMAAPLTSSMREFDVVDLGFLAESIFILLEVCGVLGINVEVFGIVPIVVLSLPDEVLLLPRNYCDCWF